MTRRAFRTKNRNQMGQTMGVVDLMIVVPLLVGGIILMMNVAMGLFLKQKLAFVAGETARYSYGLGKSDVTQATAFAKELMEGMGLDPTTTKVEVTDTSIAGQEAVKAKVTSSITMFGNVDWLPKTITVTDQAISAGNGLRVMGYLHVFQPSNESFGGGQWGAYGAMTNGHYVPIVKPSAETKSLVGNGDQTGINSGSTFEEVQKPVARLRIMQDPTGRPTVGAIGGPQAWNARTGYLTGK